MKTAKKSQKRVRLIDEICATLKDKDIYAAIKAGELTEAELRRFNYPFLLHTLKRIFREWKPDVRDVTIDRNARKALVWGGATGRSIPSIELLGVKHIPDFEINFSHTSIGIEYKRGKSGQTLRSGFAQALVYAIKYSFVIYLYVDVSEGQKILTAMKSESAQDFLDSLWEHYNIRFEVV
jgi:hypothetical protein